MEVDRSLQTLLASSIVARELHGEVVPIDGAPIGAGRMAMTVRQPLGVIGIITPFNVPLNLTLHKLGPALAGGNAVVHKPAEQTPLSALKLANIVREAGAPVRNLQRGYRSGKHGGARPGGMSGRRHDHLYGQR